MNLIRDIVTSVVSLGKGLWVTLVNGLRPKTTIRYPWQRREVAPRYRGLLVLRRDQDGQLKCTACGACERVCPVRAISLEAEGKGKERRPIAYSVDYGRCMFCRLCVEECPFEALAMSSEHEYAVYGREGLVKGIEEVGAAGRPRGMTAKELRGEQAEVAPAAASAQEGAE
jgi:NADH-quinone oxidoreductase chain I